MPFGLAAHVQLLESDWGVVWIDLDLGKSWDCLDLETDLGLNELDLEIDLGLNMPLLGHSDLVFAPAHHTLRHLDFDLETGPDCKNYPGSHSTPIDLDQQGSPAGIDLDLVQNQYRLVSFDHDLDSYLDFDPWRMTPLHLLVFAFGLLEHTCSHSQMLMQNRQNSALTSWAAHPFQDDPDLADIARPYQLTYRDGPSQPAVLHDSEGKHHRTADPLYSLNSAYHGILHLHALYPWLIHLQKEAGNYKIERNLSHPVHPCAFDHEESSDLHDL